MALFGGASLSVFSYPLSLWSEPFWSSTYKQISEGYEDRERFIILQKVGLDQKQIKQTINKQVLTVFFLPLLFAFIHLAFAYHMLSLILKVIGVIDTNMMLIVTLSICAIFLIAYVLIFMITSRSYRKIVQM